MERKAVCQQYIHFLQVGDISAILSLFAKDGLVDSPLYGIRSASDFYSALGADTADSQLKIHGIYQDMTTGNYALYFNYKWTIAGGYFVDFDVVDILEFDEQDKIAKLKIIYDTVKARKAFSKLRS